MAESPLAPASADPFAVLPTAEDFLDVMSKFGYSARRFGCRHTTTDDKGRCLNCGAQVYAPRPK